MSDNIIITLIICIINLFNRKKEIRKIGVKKYYDNKIFIKKW